MLRRTGGRADASSFATSSATEDRVCGGGRSVKIHNGRDARCPSEEGREFVTGIWPPEFERILNGESASMLAQDAQLGKL